MLPNVRSRRASRESDVEFGVKNGGDVVGGEGDGDETNFLGFSRVATTRLWDVAT